MLLDLINSWTKRFKFIKWDTYKLSLMRKHISIRYAYIWCIYPAFIRKNKLCLKYRSTKLLWKLKKLGILAGKLIIKLSLSSQLDTRWLDKLHFKLVFLCPGTTSKAIISKTEKWPILKPEVLNQKTTWIHSIAIHCPCYACSTQSYLKTIDLGHRTRKIHCMKTKYGICSPH